MKDQNEIESVVKEWLDEIKPVPPRNPQLASRGRAQFLGMAVSVSELPRQKGWISIFRKERYAMNVLLSILVIAGLLFGGGATVRAAQDDLPNEPLYGLKTWTEDLGLRFQNNGEEKVNRLMELAQTRIREMQQLAEAGEPIPDQLRLRLKQHIHQALQICVNLDDPTLERTLLQLHERLQQQDQDMAQLQLRTQEQLQLHTQDQSQTQTQERLQQQTQTRTMLHQQLQLVEDGLKNQELFRYRVENNFQYGQEEEITPPVQNQNQEQNGQPNPDPDNNTNNSGGGNSNDSGSGGGGNDNDSGGSGKP